MLPNYTRSPTNFTSFKTRSLVVIFPCSFQKLDSFMTNQSFFFNLIEILLCSFQQFDHTTFWPTKVHLKILMEILLCSFQQLDHTTFSPTSVHQKFSWRSCRDHFNNLISLVVFIYSGHVIFYVNCENCYCTWIP